MKIQIRKLIAGLCLSLILVSCGFHLRGAYKLPKQMQRTLIVAELQPGILQQNLEQALERNKIDLVEDVIDADAVLHVFDEKTVRRIISVDSQGRAQEYSLSYQIKFELNAQAKDSPLTIAPQSLQLQRDYLFDPEDILGKAREEQILIDDMQKEMVRLILLRLQLKANH